MTAQDTKDVTRDQLIEAIKALDPNARVPKSLSRATLLQMLAAAQEAHAHKELRQEQEARTAAIQALVGIDARALWKGHPTTSVATALALQQRCAFQLATSAHALGRTLEMLGTIIQHAEAAERIKKAVGQEVPGHGFVSPADYASAVDALLAVIRMSSPPNVDRVDLSTLRDAADAEGYDLVRREKPKAT